MGVCHQAYASQLLPYNYEHTLYNKLHNLRQGNCQLRNMHPIDFFNMAARIPSAESETQMISHFIIGLHPQKQNATTIQSFFCFGSSSTCNSYEVQLRSPWGTSQRFQNSTLSDSSTRTTSEGPNTSDIPKT